MLKKIITTEKCNQTLGDIVRTFLHGTPEIIRGRHRIYQTVNNMQFPLAFHQDIYVYIYHWQSFKRILFCSYGHEDHNFPNTRKIRSHRGVLLNIWSGHLNLWAVKVKQNNPHELNKSYADGENEYGTKKFQAMCLIVFVDSDRYSGIWNDLNNGTLLATDNYPKTTTDACGILFCYKKPTPPHQVNAPAAAVTFIQIGDTDKNKTVPGNDRISLP